MFPAVKELMGEEELVDLGQQMAQLKGQLQQQQAAKT